MIKIPWDFYDNLSLDSPGQLHRMRLSCFTNPPLHPVQLQFATRRFDIHFLAKKPAFWLIKRMIASQHAKNMNRHIRRHRKRETRGFPESTLLFVSSFSALAHHANLLGGALSQLAPLQSELAVRCSLVLCPGPPAPDTRHTQRSPLP